MVAPTCPRLEKSPGSLSGRGSCRDEDAISKALRALCFAVGMAEWHGIPWLCAGQRGKLRVPECGRDLGGGWPPVSPCSVVAAARHGLCSSK